jgi:hypothetical protein
MDNDGLSIPIPEKYLLTCREAAAYFNIGVKTMRCMARDSSLKVGVTIRGRMFIVRTQFEKYILHLMEKDLSEAQTAPVGTDNVIGEEVEWL